MDNPTVLVTGVGGNVGQGIVRNIRKSFPAFWLVGTNTTAFSAGNHLCDSMHTVPFAYDPSYISVMRRICEEERVSLIVPSTDYESFYLASHESLLPARIAASSADACGVYLDKYQTYLHHQRFSIPFAKSLLPSHYQGEFKSCIAKPRKGRGSRGLILNPTEWKSLVDDDYMIQEFHPGKEITTAFYVNRDNKLHGHITLLRQLDHGATSQCKVITEYDEKLLPILEQMIQAIGLRGSVNLQSIVTEDGTIQPFEVNCRISGTNSIRANFGFEDVKYTIEEFLLDRPASQPNVSGGVAVRILMDVIYPDQTDFAACRDRSTPHYLY